jgi:hypothetical protein
VEEELELLLGTEIEGCEGRCVLDRLSRAAFRLLLFVDSGKFKPS